MNLLKILNVMKIIVLNYKSLSEKQDLNVLFNHNMNVLKIVSQMNVQKLFLPLMNILKMKINVINVKVIQINFYKYHLLIIFLQIYNN